MFEQQNQQEGLTPYDQAVNAGRTLGQSIIANGERMHQLDLSTSMYNNLIKGAKDVQQLQANSQ